MIRRAETEDAGMVAALAIKMWTDHEPKELAEE